MNEIKNEISHHQKELKKLFESLSLIQNKIVQVLERKNQYKLVTKNIKETIKEFNLLMEKINVDDIKKDPKLKEIEEKILKNDLKAENYMNLVSMAYHLQEIEESLPKNEDFFLLESELKKLKGKGLVKKVTSIFDKSGFENYKSDLNQKKYHYNEMVIAFNSYWDFKDEFDKKYKLFYPQETGKPDEDALESYLISIAQLEKLIPLKKAYLEKKLDKEVSEILIKSIKFILIL